MADMIRWGERLFLIPLSVLVILRIAPQVSAHPHLVLFLLSEIVGVNQHLDSRILDLGRRRYHGIGIERKVCKRRKIS